MGRNINIPLLVTDRTSWQQVRKNVNALYNMITQLDLIGMYRTLHSIISQ